MQSARRRFRLGFSLALALLAVLFSPADASAQFRPDWRLARRAVDQYGPLDVTAPRWAHHALHVVASDAAYRVLRRAGVSSLPAAIGGGVAVGLVPHALGLALHAYTGPLDWPDGLADAWIGGASPLLLSRPCAARIRSRRCLLGAVVYLAGYAVAAPHASP